MVKVLAGLGILAICAYVFMGIHNNALATKDKVSRVYQTFFGDYGSYLKDSLGYGIFIILILLSLFALTLIIIGCFFENNSPRK